MREVTDDEYRACADAVLRMYATISGQFAVKAEDQVKFQACFPIAMYALNQVNAALSLADRLPPYVAVSNVRVAFEHAVTSQWVLFTEGAEERLVGTLNRANRLVIADLSKHAEVPELLQTGYGRDGEPSMPSFEARCATFEQGSKTLYTIYRTLSGAVHPSIATLLQHLRLGDDGNIAGIDMAAAKEPPPDLWLACALSAVAAAFTIEALRDDRPRLPEVIRLSEEALLPCNLAARDDPC